jgi:hypothetical protein
MDTVSEVDFKEVIIRMINRIKEVVNIHLNEFQENTHKQLMK